MNENENALFETVKTRNMIEIRHLLEIGVDVNVQDKYGWAPLHEATNKGFLNLCKLLIERGADINITDYEGNTPLHIAVVAGEKDICNLLISNEADVNAKDMHNRTPLYYAVDVENIDICTLLIEHGADINIKDEDGMTALDYCSKEQREVLRAKYLIYKTNRETAKTAEKADICDGCNYEWEI